MTRRYKARDAGTRDLRLASGHESSQWYQEPSHLLGLGLCAVDQAVFFRIERASAQAHGGGSARRSLQYARPYRSVQDCL